MKPSTVPRSAAKLFRVLVVGGLSLAAAEGCSSTPGGGGEDGGSTDDAAGQEAASGSPSDTGAPDDVMTQGEVETHPDSAPADDAMEDSCTPFDARVDFPNEAGICPHGLCAW
jgi:hypothetical protein